MKEVLHFKSTQERLAYLRGGFEEIEPQEAKKKPKKADSKPKNEKKTPKTEQNVPKTELKGDKIDEVPAK